MEKIYRNPVDIHAINIKYHPIHSINKTFQVLICNHIYSKRIPNYNDT